MEPAVDGEKQAGRKRKTAPQSTPPSPAPRIPRVALLYHLGVFQVRPLHAPRASLSLDFPSLLCTRPLSRCLGTSEATVTRLSLSLLSPTWISCCGICYICSFRFALLATPRTSICSVCLLPHTVPAILQGLGALGWVLTLASRLSGTCPHPRCHPRSPPSGCWGFRSSMCYGSLGLQIWWPAPVLLVTGPSANTSLLWPQLPHLSGGLYYTYLIIRIRGKRLLKCIIIIIDYSKSHTSLNLRGIFFPPSNISEIECILQLL